MAHKNKHYHAILQMALTVSGLSAQAEFATSHGRIDIVVDLARVIYIIEVKLNASAADALAQIEERKYYERFLSRNKSIILLGISFMRGPSMFEVEYETKTLKKTI